MALRIEKMASDAIGIAHDNGKTIFIRGTLPGELVEYEIRETKPGYIIADAVEILEKSEMRRAPVCPYYSVCGGCSFQIVDEKDSALLKTEIVKDNLRRIAKLAELPEFEDTVYGSFEGYRHRARFHVDFSSRRAGFLGRKSSELVEISSCPALSGKLNDLFSVNRDELMKQGRSEMFQNRVDRVTGYSEVSAFEGDDEVTLNEKAIPITISGIRYYVSARVFFQSNPALLPHLFSFVEENAIGHTIMDLYSGVGTFSALFENSGRKVFAVERDRECLYLAKKNAPSAVSFSSDVALWGKKNKERAETIIVDPPRTGIGEEALSLILSWKPERIIYVSCNSATAARDIGRMAGYKVAKAKVFDFYPGTGHDESAYVIDRQ